MPIGRPISTSPISCPSSIFTTDPGRIWTHAEITPPAKFVHDKEGRRGEAVTSLVSGGCIISGSAISRSLLFTGVHGHSYGNIENAVILPYAEVGRGAQLKNVVIDRGVRIPAGLEVGEDAERDAERFRRTERHLSHHPTDDRQAVGVTPMQVLAVVSEIYPLVKTGGLADVAGALPKALKAEGIETITLVPGYPDVLSALVEADEVLCHARCYGGAARVLRGSAAGLQLLVLDAPHLFARPGNPYVGARRRRLARQCDSLRRAGTNRRRDRPGLDCGNLCRRSSTRTIGRPD